MNTLHLSGCTPQPLVSYLKALGILRVLSQQLPALDAKCCWRGNTFVFISEYDEAGLADFFLTRYAPSPIVAPWNGGSGFFPKDNSAALDTIAASDNTQFAGYRETIIAARAALASQNLSEKPEKEAKEKLLLRCRNTFSETALEWLDAAFVLTDDGTRYPPLLGTGGNDGRLEFTNNFMQRLTEVFDLAQGVPSALSAAWLSNALFDTQIKGLQDSPIGQFSPAASGGANATTGFDAKSAMNPWDFILALEGAMLFAGAALKRLESSSPGQLAYPFCVQAAGAGYGSAAQADENDARCEIWMPLWSAPARFDEIKALFGEGRAWIGNRPAKDGVDFALAIASLGVDRGISEFQRYAFLVRNGLAYFATPLQRIRVRRDGMASDLIAACDGWRARFLREGKKELAPGSVHRAAVGLENAILMRIVAAQDDDPATAQELLVALGECERVVSLRKKWRSEALVQPIPPLPSEWVKIADTGAVEYRLAAALASTSVGFKDNFYPIRRHLEPVKVVYGNKDWATWDESALSDVVAPGAKVTDLMCEIMRRRLLLAKSASAESWPEISKVSAWPGDVAAFIDGRIDEAYFIRLLWAMSLIDFSAPPTTETMPVPPDIGVRQETPPAFFAQLKLCFAGRLPGDKRVHIEPGIFTLAASGDGARASAQALRRLHGSSIPVTHIHIPLSGEAAKRCAAALLFPLWDSQLEAVCSLVAPDLFHSSTVSQ